MKKGPADRSFAEIGLRGGLGLFTTFCGGGFGLFPGALERFLHKALLDRGRGDADVADFAIYHRFDALEVGEEAALGDRSHVGADTALFLGLTAAPNVAALDRPCSS